MASASGMASAALESTKKFAGENKLSIHEQWPGAIGFVYFEQDEGSGRVAWAIKDGELQLGASWGFPSEAIRIKICKLLVLYAAAKDYYIKLA